MPIDNVSERGTEKDGSSSREYCKYCYKEGALIEPDMPLEKMRSIVSTQMKSMNLPDNLIQRSVGMLPHLKRWRNVTA